MELPLGSNSHGTCQGNFFIWCAAMVSWWHNYPRWVRLAWISYWKAFLLTTWHELMDENIIKQQAKHSLRRLGPISFPRCHDRTPARSWAKKRPRLSLLQNGWRSQVVGKRWVNFARRRRNAKSCGLQKVTKKKVMETNWNIWNWGEAHKHSNLPALPYWNPHEPHAVNWNLRILCFGFPYWKDVECPSSLCEDQIGPSLPQQPELSNNSGYFTANLHVHGHLLSKPC